MFSWHATDLWNSIDGLVIDSQFYTGLNRIEDGTNWEFSDGSPVHEYKSQLQFRKYQAYYYLLFPNV